MAAYKGCAGGRRQRASASHQPRRRALTDRINTRASSPRSAWVFGPIPTSKARRAGNPRRRGHSKEKRTDWLLTLGLVLDAGWPSWFAGFVVAPMQVLEDLSDGIGLGHSGNHPHFATALGTDADVEIEHPFEPGHPAHRGVGAGVVAGWAAGSASSSRDDEMAVAGIGGEQGVVAHQVGLGPRHQSGQAGSPEVRTTREWSRHERHV